MKAIVISILFCIISLTLSAQRNQSIHGSVAVTVNPNSESEPAHISPEFPPMYVLDGLVLTPEKMLELKVNARSIKNLEVDENYASRSGSLQYKGKIDMTTELLVVLDGKKLSGKSNKQKQLSKLDVKDITRINILDKKNALALYGKKAKGGALVIETNR